MKPSHTIQRQMFELEVIGAKAGLDWERRAVQYQEDFIAKGLEDCFHAIPATDHQLIIEKLEIDLGSFSPESFRKEARQRLVRLLGEQLQACFQEGMNDVQHNLYRTKLVNETGEKIDVQHNFYRTKPVNETSEQIDAYVLDSTTVNRVVFLHFLERGRFPWWYVKPTVTTTIETLFGKHWMKTLTDDDRDLLQYTLLQSEQARIRISNHFSAEWIGVFLQQIGLFGNDGLTYWKLLLPMLEHAPAKHAVLHQYFWVSWMKSTRTVPPYPNITTLLQIVIGKRQTLRKKLLKTLKKNCAEHLINTSFAKQARNLLNQLDQQQGIVESITNPRSDKLGIATEHRLSEARTEQISESSDVAGELPEAIGETPAEIAYEVSNRYQTGLSGQEESWFVPAAGLVLLHPFLPDLMRNLGLWQASAWCLPEAVFQGVRILSYLSFGNTDLPEYQLPFHKLLMGMDIDTALHAFSPLTRKETAACDELLHVAVDHWKALGNVSPTSLQEGFLQREGKLELRDDGYHLQIEQQALDVLLARLPWGYSTVKLPWMHKIIHTSWI